MTTLADVDPRTSVVFDPETKPYVLVDKKRINLLPAGWDFVNADTAIHAHTVAEGIQDGEAAQITGQLWAVRVVDESERGWHVKVMRTKQKR